jgi:UDP-2,3-diacylglucosamine hydrolase
LVLFLSDIHFGRRDRPAERAKEDALLACLSAHADRVEHLYLVGDVFDGYIEYRHLVPKGFVRFQALLARWTDRGVPVTYLLGNHDPWHLDYFQKELGVRLVPDALDAEHGGLRLHVTHGDAHASTHPSYAWLRPLLRHPWAMRLYRALLPADLGVALAQRVSRRLHDPAPDPAVVKALEAAARRRLRRTRTDAVVMGHSHAPAVRRWDAGRYVNLGNWYEQRTFARLDEDGLSLARWNGTRALDIEPADL